MSTDRERAVANINLFKKLLADMKAWSDKGVQCELAMIGSKGVSFFNSVGGNVVAQVTGMGITFSVERSGPVKVMLQAYDEGRLVTTLSATNLLTPCLSGADDPLNCCRCRRRR